MTVDVLRSLLLVPADNDSAVAAAFSSSADAIILDAGEWVAPGRREQAIAAITGILADRLNSAAEGKSIWVRLAPGARYHDIAMLKPSGFVLPSIDEHDALYAPDAMIALAEKQAGFAQGTIKVMASAADHAAAVLGLDTYHAPALPRLAALTWDADQLAFGVGARAYEAGAFTGLFQAVRMQVLMAAKSASLAGIETAYVDRSDFDGLRRAAVRAKADGFTAMVALDGAQADIINAVFTPSPEEVSAAQSILAEAAANFGSFWRDGKLYGEAQILAARRIVALAKTAPFKS